MSARDAKNLKASSLLKQTLHDVRSEWIDRLIDCPAGELVAAQARVRALDEFAETLNERIERALGDEGPTE